MATDPKDNIRKLGEGTLFFPLVIVAAGTLVALALLLMIAGA